MTGLRKPAVGRLMLGASAMAIGLMAQPAVAQNADAAAEQPADEIVVSGIRASLRNAMDTKRNAIGVVDAISAEDIGKFPDTNLAESLQRITGVSIDRSSGEGSTVTVRGFGPAFNLVVVNGRQMPTSFIGQGFSSRSFDFANLAAEGVAGVEVYKSGRASLPTGGIGSVINIKLPRPLDRPGFKGSFSVKGVYDTSLFEGTDLTPEFSGIISKTFAGDKIGILLAGSYQDRKASQAQFFAENWRPGYTGAENNWGTLAQPGDPRFANITNRPGPTDVYQVPQNAAYDFYDFQRERINGQAVLQFRPTDSLDITLDYVFSQNSFDSTKNSIGIWFDHGNTISSWTDGPAAGANFYADQFGGPGKDFAITGSVAANRNTNHSFGGNVKWKGPGGLRLELDAHHSTAESKPTSPYGSSIAVGTAVYGVRTQRVDNTTDMPVLSVTHFAGFEPIAANIRPAGNAFTNQYMRDEINEVALRGGFDFDASFIDTLDFGATYTENKVRTAFGTIQNDTWGGTLSAAETPDDLFTARNLPADLAGMNGSNDPSIIPTYFRIDTARLIDLLRSTRNICGLAQVPGTCLAKYSTDRRIEEKSFAPFIQSLHSFNLGDAEGKLRLGLRYEKTKIDSATLAPNPTNTVWVAANEISLISPPGSFTTAKGEYDNWLPAFDLSLKPAPNVFLRASYSHTITRPDYAAMGALVIAQPLRVGAGGSQAFSGDPALLPYKSKNIDLSAEWYYDTTSYVSVGFFHKKVSNFITNQTSQTSLFSLNDPSESAEVRAARLAGNTSYADILNYIRVNHPTLIDPVTGGILGKAADPDVIFTYQQQINSAQRAKLSGWEFAVQHSFWDTGFGAILNYTIVNSDTKYDNTLPWTVDQFAVTGVSDSANAVLYYDKNGLQARVAYNWRDKFLAGYDRDPYYVEAYGQLDVSASYEFKNGVTIFVEGINVLNTDRKGTRRNDRAVFFAAPGYARYAAGARITF